jgi:hypothetical protein
MKTRNYVDVIRKQLAEDPELASMVEEERILAQQEIELFQFTEQIATQLFVGMIAKPNGVIDPLIDYAEMAKEAVELARRAAPFLVAELGRGAE